MGPGCGMRGGRAGVVSAGATEFRDFGLGIQGCARSRRFAFSGGGELDDRARDVGEPVWLGIGQGRQFFDYGH